MIDDPALLYNPNYAAGRQKNPTAIDEVVCFHLWLLPVQVMMVLLFFVNHVLLLLLLTSRSPPPLLLLSNGVEMASNVLVHTEHIDLGLLEYGHHLLVTADLAFVFGILKVICFDVLPQLLDNLRAGKLLL